MTAKKHAFTSSDRATMQVTIFGAGAMSCLFAARLSEVALVTVVDTWKESIDKIRERGILYEDSTGTRSARVQAEYIGSTVTRAELAIVLVKSWQTEEVSKFLDSYLSSSGLAISLQNGLGNVGLLGAKSFAGSTSEGATLLGPGHVRAGGAGQTHVVAPEWVVSLLTKAGFEAYGCSPEEAQSLLWGKLCVSCGINPLTALLRIRNGELLNRPEAAELMARAAAECAAVAHAKRIRLPFPDAALHARDVAKKTADNKSSMLQDLLRGAPTECDAINGAVVREGRAVDVETPVNDILWQLIRAAVRP